MKSQPSTSCNVRFVTDRSEPARYWECVSRLAAQGFVQPASTSVYHQACARSSEDSAGFVLLEDSTSQKLETD